MPEEINYKKRHFTNRREAYEFASKVTGYVDGPFYDFDLNTEYIVFYKDAREELANGVLLNGTNWWWCLYNTEELADKVRRACEMVSPVSTISDVCETTYKDVTAYGFRVHK